MPVSPNLSVVIPTLNEAGNIEPLIRRLDKALRAKTTFELIFIDDHSTDGSYDKLIALQAKYPRDMSVYTKEGKPGKSTSLLEGISHAKYPIVAMIDGDLQYPPEAIPHMLKNIASGDDVVIAHRRNPKSNALRRKLSGTGRKIYGSWLHGLDYDVQSGLKVFRKEIVERTKITPTPWTFDLEFLTLARDAGYSISEIYIPFAERTSGKSKIHTLRSGTEILGQAVKLKAKGHQVIPVIPRPRQNSAQAGFHYRGKHYVTHTNLHHSESALRQLSRRQSLWLSISLAILAALLIFRGHSTLTAIIAIVTTVYFADLIYNLFLISRSFSRQIDISVSTEELTDNSQRQWPMYTIFCPLYKEWAVLPQFVTAMNRLDYPKNKLQIMLLLEEDDTETIAHARQMGLPQYFQIVVVPDSSPKTKPKACNYGLTRAIGEYAVIYDAEDVPEPDQLKKALLAFEKSPDNVACIQAKLNFYNPRQNVLTRAFTAEYSLWFDLVLTGLQSANAPIPLGGTSNHFITKVLKQLHGWDAFNVTEDCDLGIRLAKRGFRTAIVDSVTLEEANSAGKNWFHQRTRWIKGYIQTYWVHMRDLKSFKFSVKEPQALTFQLIVGGKIASMFINPLMWVVTISYFVFRSTIGPTIESFYPAPILYMGVTCIIFGNFLYMYYYMLGCAKREQYDLIKYAYLVPFYWLAMSTAAWVALFKLFYQPHHWFKTQHGLHLSNDKAMGQIQAVLGQDLVDEHLIAVKSPAQTNVEVGV